MTTILHSIKMLAIENPDKIAIINANGIGISYTELWEKITSTAKNILASGTDKGKRVILYGHNDIETVILYFAHHLAGLVNVVVDPKWNEARIQHLLILTDARLPFEIEVGHAPATDSQAEIELELPEPDSVADIMFTSGTTGEPKCVPLTHANILGSANNINAFIQNNSSDIELIGLPMCHSFALGRLRCSLIKGATIVLSEGFGNIKKVFDLIERYKVTGLGMVPAVFSYIKKFSGNRIGKFAAQLRYIEIGSSSMPMADKELLMNLFPTTRLCMHYGMTEASRMTFLEFHSMYEKLSSVGLPTTGDVSIKIMGENGETLPINEDGEICVTGNMVTAGYILTETPRENFFSGGYFRTGDYGHFDSEGFLYLAARKKEMINVGGKKVNPIEIEDILESLGVRESMCVAIPDPSGILGEVPMVLLEDGSFDGDVEKIKDGLQQKLEAYKMPRKFEIVKSIPKTESGKKIRTGYNV